MHHNTKLTLYLYYLNRLADQPEFLHQQQRILTLRSKLLTIHFCSNFHAQIVQRGQTLESLRWPTGAQIIDWNFLSMMPGPQFELVMSLIGVSPVDLLDSDVIHITSWHHMTVEKHRGCAEPGGSLEIAMLGFRLPGWSLHVLPRLHTQCARCRAQTS